MAILRSLAGATGKAIDTIGTKLGNPFGQGVRGIDISATLQNYGGNAAGSLRNALVPQAYASEPNVLGPQTMYKKVNYDDRPLYGPAPVQKINNTSGGNTGTKPPAYYPQMSFNAPNQPSYGDKSEMDIINDEFNSVNSVLDQQEGQANSNFNETKGLYDTIKANNEATYKKNQETQITDAKKQGALDLGKVRQLLSELSQGNAARTAITGGGSVSEVLAERFGREAQARVGGVMEQTSRLIQRANDFYNDKITQLNETYQANILQAKQALEDTLSQIRGARAASAAAKQRGMMDAWKQYYNDVNNYKIQQADYQAKLDMWKQQQDNSLAAMGGFNSSNANQYNEGVQPLFSDVAQANVAQQTRDPYNPQYVYKKSSKPNDEELQNLQYTGILPSPGMGGF